METAAWVANTGLVVVERAAAGLAMAEKVAATATVT